MKHFIIAILAFLFLGSALPALAADTTRPTVGLASPSVAVVGVPVVVSATVTDEESGIASCRLYMDNEDVAGMTLSGTTASVSFVYVQAGIHTIFVFCRDAAGNFQSGLNTSVTVTAASGSGDNNAPSVGSIATTSAFAGVSTLLSASVTDEGTGVSGCLLFVNNFSKGNMVLASGSVSLAYVFQDPGTYSVYIQCFDGAGNSGTNAPVSFTVTAPFPSVPVPLPLAVPALVKLPCQAGDVASSPCRAVYYRGSDGKRRAFPNASTYFTWYTDFSTVQEISASAMAALPLAKQVTYRPGVKLVKFATENKVYAVARGGVLRWIKSEAVAVALYGSDWNKKIDDISDAFYLDYAFGNDINMTQDFSPSAEMAAAPKIE
ncbi:MAG: Ig-like domain-containing protein [Patescibacteria group bacterium]|jgi:hypothetical protein